MANVIKHKRGSGSDPSASDLILGELAIRTDTGKLFTKMDSGAIAEIAGGGSDIAINTLSSSSATGGGSATFNGSAYRFTLSAPPNVSAAQLLVSINGVIQKPVAGTGQPSEGFSVDGTDIILGDAPAAGSDFFILTFKSLGVSEPADNSVTSAKIVDGTIVTTDLADDAVTGAKIADDTITDDHLAPNSVRASQILDGQVGTAELANASVTNLKVDANAAIDGTKINPNFGSQGIDTTGDLSVGDDITITGHNPHIFFVDSSDNPDYKLQHGGGELYIQDVTNGVARFKVNADGHIDIAGNLDVGAGIDVTGAITGTGDLTIDTNTLHVDSSNNRVGIGTTSPSNILTISAANPVLELAGTANTTGDTFLHFNANANHWCVGADNFSSQNNFVIKSGTPASSSHTFLINSSGNVGIGGTAPNYQLHVVNGIGVGAHGFAQQLSIGNNSIQSLLLGTGYTNLSLNALGGSVGIGTTSPSGKLDIQTGTNGNVLIDAEGGSVNHAKIVNDSGDLTLGARNTSADTKLTSQRHIHFLTGGSEAERMRIDSSGNVLIGMTSASTTTQGMMFRPGQESSIFRDSGFNLLVGGAQSGQRLIDFRHNGASIGHISKSGTTGISYNEGSDYRLKENAVAISDGITRLKTLKPYRFNFKADASTTVDGFFAHEVTAVPEAISGTKDEVDENNEPVYQGIDKSKLVPLLVAALQEAIGRIEVLEAK